MADKKCPFCAELIKSEAIKCKHCGSDVPKVSKPTEQKSGCLPIFLAGCAILFVLGALGRCSEALKSPEQRQAEEKVLKKHDAEEKSKAAAAQLAEKKEKQVAEAAEKQRVKGLERKYGKFYAAMNGCEIYGFKVDDPDEYSRYITGTLVNNTGEDLRYLSINGEELDKSGNVLDSPFTNLAGLASGGTWKFRLLCHNDQAVRYKLTRIVVR